MKTFYSGFVLAIGYKAYIYLFFSWKKTTTTKKIVFNKSKQTAVA